MRFEAVHTIDGTLAEVERAFLDPRYLEFAKKHHPVLLEADVLESKTEGRRVHRKVRYLPRPVIQKVGPNEVPPHWFQFVEESTWDADAHTLTFKNTPTSDQIARLLHNVGTLRYREVNGRCERRMEGEIALRLPFLLKPIAVIGEAVIHREGLKILDAEVPVMNRFLAEVLRAGTSPAHSGAP